VDVKKYFITIDINIRRERRFTKHLLKPKTFVERIIDRTQKALSLQKPKLNKGRYIEYKK